jgi:hypothetical protein
MNENFNISLPYLQIMHVSKYILWIDSELFATVSILISPVTHYGERIPELDSDMFWLHLQLPFRVFVMR